MKFGDDVGNELNSKNLSQIFYFFPFFLRYSVCSGNLAQKHYYEFKIEFKNNKALKYKSQTHYFCLICSDHVPRKKKRVDWNASSNKLILKNVLAWMTKLPFCSVAKIMKINYISVLLSFKNMFTFAGLVHIIFMLSQWQVKMPIFLQWNPWGSHSLQSLFLKM